MSIKLINRYECKCDRPKCGHTWVTRAETLPKVCPECKREDWNTESSLNEPLTETGRESMLNTLRAHITAGRRPFAMSLENTVTPEDWQWLMSRIS